MDAWTLAHWTGRKTAQTEVLGAAPARAMAATLDQDPDGFGTSSELPPLWLWLYHLPVAKASDVGPDGHPKLGVFLPPIALPRRMWAGSRCVFHAPARIGEAVTKVSTIAKVVEKTGRVGEMVFVTVQHEWTRGDTLLVEEEQDIVYLQIPEVFTPPPPVTAPEGDWRESVAIDPVLLFRFSALTFNGHRIHYDRTYATEREKYPGLVVHGPLQAILLIEAARRWVPGLAPARFDFRGLRPLFDFDAVSVCGRKMPDGGLELHTSNADGAAGMQARLVSKARSA